MDNYAGMLGSEIYGLYSSYDAKIQDVTIYNSSGVSSIYCDSVYLYTNNLTINGNS